VLAFFYLAVGLLLIAIGVGLYFYRRPLEWYDRYLRSQGRWLSWPGPEEWQQMQEKGQSFAIRFVMPAFLILFGIIMLIAGVSAA
jgi:hypothetical protein